MSVGASRRPRRGPSLGDSTPAGAENSQAALRTDRATDADGIPLTCLTETGLRYPVFVSSLPLPLEFMTTSKIKNTRFEDLWDDYAVKLEIEKCMERERDHITAAPKKDRTTNCEKMSRVDSSAVN